MQACPKEKEEAKSNGFEADRTVDVDASQWSPTEPEEEDEEKQHNITLHAMQNKDLDGPDKIALTTKQAIQRLERIPGVKATYDSDGSWKVRTSWRGQELVRMQVDTFQEAINAVIEDVAPAATRSVVLDDIAEEKGESWVKMKLSIAKMDATMGK